MNTSGLILVVTLEILQNLCSTDVSYTATRKITFLHCSTSCVQCILDAVLLLFHLYLSSSTYIKYSYTAGEFAETLLKFLLIVIRSRSRNLLSDKLYTLCDILFVTCTAYDSGVLLCDGNLLCFTEHLRSCVLKSKSSFL